MTEEHLRAVDVHRRQRERTRAEFRDVLKRSGFRLKRVIATETHLSVIEGVRV